MQSQDNSINAPALPYRIDNTGKADLLDKINPDRVVEEIKNRLMGREFIRKNMRWEDNFILKKNAVSELCANDMATLVLSVSNPNVSISKLKDEEIRKRAYGVMEAAIKMLIANWKDYRITNIAQITYVSEIVFSVSFITMKQCEGEGIRKMVVGSRQETHLSTDTERERRGLFGRRANG